MDADDVVLGFLTPPGAGKDGVPLQTLFGFERVHLKAGETQTVYLYPALTEFAPVGVDGTRRALEGTYTAHPQDLHDAPELPGIQPCRRNHPAGSKGHRGL